MGITSHLRKRYGDGVPTALGTIGQRWVPFKAVGENPAGGTSHAVNAGNHKHDSLSRKRLVDGHVAEHRCVVAWAKIRS